MIRNLFNKENNHIKTSGLILDVNDNYITLRLFDATRYKKGQYVLVGIPFKRKTALGQSIWVSDNIACGEISNVNNDEITIKSSLNSPIIARLTVKDNIGKKHEMLIDRVR